MLSTRCAREASDTIFRIRMWSMLTRFDPRDYCGKDTHTHIYMYLKNGED